MAITASVGYAGTITDADWRRMAVATIGAMYGVEDFDSWRVTNGAGDRAVRIAAGAGFGLGVRDVAATPTTLTLDPVSSGSRWDLIVVHRDWDAKLSAFAKINGSSVAALPARDIGFGAENDQPIALARVAAGQTAVQEIIDLRCIPGDGGLLAFHDLARTYLDRVGTSVRIGSAVWDRVVDALGSPAWVSAEQVDTGWVGVPLSAGWDAVAGYALQVRAVGAHCLIRGAARVDTTAALAANVAVLPQAFRPSGTQFLGSVQSNRTFAGELHLSANGQIGVPSGYQTGSLGIGGLLPIHGSWFRG